jgi:hypothetical protein
MQFRIADTFTDSLARLTAAEQKAAKLTAFDLQMNPATPGHAFHRLDRARDEHFWSVRVNADLRLIVHRTSASLLLAYVDHHDGAYRWAERRKIERHPTTGAMQLVELVDMVEGSERDPFAVEAKRWAVPPDPDEHPQWEPPRPTPVMVFVDVPRERLLSYGVPPDWIEPVRAVKEDGLFDILSHLPQEAQEALLKLAVGETPEPPALLPAEADPYRHPDAQRRFRVLTNVEELRQALDYPWDKWAVFLHPAQSALVERAFSGPARVSGSAGTGKTVVALHRAAHLARRDQAARVLLTTFSRPLAEALRGKLASLVGEPEIAARITVKAIGDVGRDLYTERFGEPTIAAPDLIERMIAAAADAMGGHAFPLRFLRAEWTDIVDAWQVTTWEAYRDVARLGRKTRIGGKQRETLWAIFSHVRADLAERKLLTQAQLFARLGACFASGAARPYDHAVVDEAQDLGVAEARFLAALCGDQPDGLFFAGDLGQRIFQQPFSWKALGIDVRGRSVTLRINYRTSHQIRSHADRLLPPTVSDVDGNREGRRGTVSLFDGPAPRIVACTDAAAETATVGAWIAERLREGCQPHEIGVFVRSEAELDRARAALTTAQARFALLGEAMEVNTAGIAIGSMHEAKGLEFKACAVMACDDEIIPLQSRIESVADDADLEEFYETERHLLYVACTRARDQLLVTGVEPVSEFLEDLRAPNSPMAWRPVSC